MWFAMKAALAITILAFLLLILICGPYYLWQFYEKFRGGLTRERTGIRARRPRRSSGVTEEGKKPPN